MFRATAALALFLALTVIPAARAESVDDPSLAGAKEGDWIEHRIVMPPELGMETSTRQTIAKLTASDVSVQQETKMTMGGKPMPPSSQSVTRPRKIEKSKADSAKADGKAKPKQETIKGADGKEYACNVYEIEEQGKKAKTWICPELPLGGMIRSEADGKVLMEMIGWGRGK